MKQAVVENLVHTIENRILVVRDQKVLLDRDLAEVYQVETRVLNQAVKRNLARFPIDFMFQLTLEETGELKTLTSQIVMLRNRGNVLSSEKQKPGANLKHRPFVLTEHGAIMLASVLNSPTAIRASVEVVRAFVRLRAAAFEHADLRGRLDDLEKKYDSQFRTVFLAVKELMKPAPKERERKIGFLSAQNELFDAPE